jgi:hypothetical protein
MALPIPPAQSSMAAAQAGPAPGPDVALGSGAASAESAVSAAQPGIRASKRSSRQRSEARPLRRLSGATPELRWQARLFRVSDTVVVLCVLLLVFIATNIGAMP